MSRSTTSECIQEGDQSRFHTIEEYQFVDRDVFQVILRRKRPAILKNCCFGDCMTKWKLDYLNEKLKEEPVVIHESDSPNLDFLNKNFKYRSCLFSQFTQQLIDRDSNLHVYLRSTNRNPRANKPARIEDDFAAISDDLVPPDFIPFGQDNDQLYHSSVLRIASSNVQIWTHFDLYDNVLCQVIGSKRIILFDPKDTEYLYIEGDKSSVNNLDKWSECIEKFPLLNKTEPYRCLLVPGDVIFIPALWWHNIRTIENDIYDSGYSIGFNIFWRDHEVHRESLYADRDVYGNKNLVPFDFALANLDKAVSHLDKLPEKYKTFYKHMLLVRLKSKLFPGQH